VSAAAVACVAVAVLAAAAAAGCAIAAAARVAARVERARVSRAWRGTRPARAGMAAEEAAIARARARDMTGYGEGEAS
jgi:hypothetical protein